MEIPCVFWEVGTYKERLCVLFGSHNKQKLNISISWDINVSSPLKVNRRFGGICHLHLQNKPSKKPA
jgi:hypothetical protein